MSYSCFQESAPRSQKGSPRTKLTVFLRPWRSLHLAVAIGAAGLCGQPATHAGLTLQLQLYHSAAAYYLLFPSLNTNSASANPPNTGYFVWSHGSSANSGSHGQIYADGTSANGSGVYADFASFIQEITNRWTLLVTNSVATNTYAFSVTDFGSNAFPAVTVTFPADGAVGVTNQPTFTWQGPTNYQELFVQLNNSDDSFVQNAYLPLTQTNWTSPVPLGYGSNYFFTAIYNSNATASIVASIPIDSSSQPFPGWTSTSWLQAYAGPSFTVTIPPSSSGSGHRLVAHYAFDNSGDLGKDTSGDSNDMLASSWWGPVHLFTSNAVAGSGALQFFGTSNVRPDGSTLTNWLATLAGSFSISTWVKTTNSTGNDSDNAYFGATIFWAFNDHNSTNDTIPLAITGSKAAFTTRDHLGNFTTLHSISPVNDGYYHLLTVTREDTTGRKNLYVDGNFEASEIGTTDPLNGNDYYLSIGGSVFSSYTGLVDDVQIYSGVLSPFEISSLYANPGVTSPDGSGSGLQAHYDFDEGTVLAPDVSGNGNPIIYAGNFGGSGPGISSDTIAGSGSVSFDGGSYLTASSNLLATLAADFSVSVWVKTSQSLGSLGDMAYWGAVIVSADIVAGAGGDAVPIALTGGQVAFNTGDGTTDQTLGSTATVNDGSWHHLVVTRNLSTGEKQIFIDGALDSSQIGTMVRLDGPKLLTIGAKSDASDPDPSSPDSNGSQGYEGLLDDLQVYSRVLSAAEVTYLNNNPGATLGGTVAAPYPVDVDLSISIVRKQELSGSETYLSFPSFNSINPAPTTTNRVSSPNGGFVAESEPSRGYSSSWILNSLGDVLKEWTNGLWTLYVNQGSPTQQVYTFSVTLSGLDTNILPAARILSPLNGSLNVATNPPFYWSGPSNFSALIVDIQGGPSANLPVTATNWPAPPALPDGTNVFEVTYNSTDFPNVTFTKPVDAAQSPVRTWTTHVLLQTTAVSLFVVGAPAPPQVQLTKLGLSGGLFQFSFTTLAGRAHTIQACTNLTPAAWLDLSNFHGDGTLRDFSFQTTNPPIRFFRVKTN
jgi:hypothetical protein